MSNKAITWSLHQQGISATGKHVLLVLCNAALEKEDLTCRRSISLLAKETNLNRRTIIRVVADLIANQKIERSGYHSDGSAIYRVLAPQNHTPQCRTATPPVSKDHTPSAIGPLVGSGTESHITKENQYTSTKSICAPLPGIEESEMLELGESGNCIMTEKQFNTLNAKLNGNLDRYVKRFDRWIEEMKNPKTGKVPAKYRNRQAYFTIQNWHDTDVTEGKISPAPAPQDGLHRFKAVV